MSMLGGMTEINRIIPEWAELWSRCHRATTFQRPQWLVPWIEVFRPSDPVFLEVRSGDRLVGIAPLLLYRRSAERVLALMGGGVSDYLDVLVDPKFDREALCAIHQFVVNEIPEWDVAEFTDIAGESPLLKSWPTARRIQGHDACPVLNLPASEEALKTVVPPHKLRNLRNARRRLERASGGQVQLANRETLADLLEIMMSLHEKRWSESSRTGMLAEDAVKQFHRCVAPQLLDAGVLRLYALRLDDRCIAAIYTMFEKATAYCYLQGYDPQFRAFSPGTQILGHVIEDAVRGGITKINFLRGREPYKYGWGATDETTFCLRESRGAVSLAVTESKVAA